VVYGATVRTIVSLWNYVNTLVYHGITAYLLALFMCSSVQIFEFTPVEKAESSAAKKLSNPPVLFLMSHFGDFGAVGRALLS
jgi:hypothetical protein